MNFIRFHSGGIQDPRPKIAEGSFPVLLDPEPRPNKFHSVSFGFIRARPGSKIAVKDLSAVLILGSWIPPERISFGFIRGRSWIQTLQGITSSSLGSSWTSKVPKVMAQDPTARVYRPYVIPCFRLYCQILPRPFFGMWSFGVYK